MSKALMRDGRMIANPLEGCDLSKLNQKSIDRMQTVINKMKHGTSISKDDLSHILEARDMARETDPMSQAAAAVRKMKEIFS